ncbi:hypothetical protein F5Y06DRAFT_261689 [Hypoxylon sp. FL0890]|nr:hypothetical protein F5Y06DRAFT_261689 [Hypoxylon sp. FL0890]
MAKSQGPPYASPMAIVGGEPTPAIDDPIAVALLLLFLFSAAAHLAIMRINKNRHLKFVFSGMLFALCLLRCVSLAARMIWASYPKTVNAAIAASVMTQCGSVLIFIVNLFLAQRVFRAYHPRLGWHRGTCYVLWFLIACVVCCLVMAIVATVHAYFTLDQRGDRAVQLFAGLYLMLLAFLPVPVVLIAAATRPRHFHVEKFGAGRWRSKVWLLVFTALVATLGAAFRVGVSFDRRPATNPAWFHSKACYYCFNFVTDLVVSTAYLVARFDKRFIVPDGGRRPGDYSPILPSTDSHKSLVGKLPLMGTSRPITMMRKPRVPTPIAVPPSPQMATVNTDTIPPSTPYSSQPQMNDLFADISNPAGQNRPTTSNSCKRKSILPILSLHSLNTNNNNNNNNHSNSNIHRWSGLMARGRRGVMVRMRINSEADADPLMHQDGGVRAPDPAHLGPPILPDLDLDLELLSATLLAPWALDSWGFDVRLSSRNGSLTSKSNRSRSSKSKSRSNNSSRSRSGTGSGSGNGSGNNSARNCSSSYSSHDTGGNGGNAEGSSGWSICNFLQRAGRSMTM